MAERVWIPCSIEKALEVMQTGEAVLFKRDSWRKWVRSSTIVHQYVSVQELPSMRWARPHPADAASLTGLIYESETTINIKEAV